MKVLVACEFSGIVRDAFIAEGHEAYSADLVPSERPGPHYLGNVLGLLDQTMFTDKLDLLIAFPPCTYLANSGVRWLYGGKGKVKDKERWKLMEQGAGFFDTLLNGYDIPKIAIENPVMHGYARQLICGEPAQTIQPWQFGHDEAKATQLWLKNLPLLVPTNILPLSESGHRGNQTPSGQNKLGPSPTRARERSRTYTGIAQAMAKQWGQS